MKHKTLVVLISNEQHKEFKIKCIRANTTMTKVLGNFVEEIAHSDIKIEDLMKDENLRNVVFDRSQNRDIVPAATIQDDDDSHELPL